MLIEQSSSTPETPLQGGLREVNRIRVEHGAEPLAEWPKATVGTGGWHRCLLGRAFEDTGEFAADLVLGEALVGDPGNPFLRRIERAFEYGLLPEALYENPELRRLFARESEGLGRKLELV